MITVKEVIGDRPLFAIGPDATARQASKKMANKNVGALPVLQQNRLVGMISERDIVRRCVGLDLDCTQTRVKDLMTRKPIVADSEDSVLVAMTKMMERNIRHLPVVHDGQLIGTLSIREAMYAMRDVTLKQMGYHKPRALSADRDLKSSLGWTGQKYPEAADVETSANIFIDSTST